MASPFPDSSAQVLFSRAQPLYLCRDPARGARALVPRCPIPSTFLTLAPYKARTNLNHSFCFKALNSNKAWLCLKTIFSLHLWVSVLGSPLTVSCWPALNLEVCIFPGVQLALSLTLLEQLLVIFSVWWDLITNSSTFFSPPFFQAVWQEWTKCCQYSH